MIRKKNVVRTTLSLFLCLQLTCLTGCMDWLLEDDEASSSDSSNVASTSEKTDSGSSKAASFDEYYSDIRDMLADNPDSLTDTGEDFQSGRIIVSSAGDDFQSDSYGATAVAEDPDGNYVLQFSSPSEAEEAYNSISQDYSDANVEEDVIFTAFDVNVDESIYLDSDVDFESGASYSEFQSDQVQPSGYSPLVNFDYTVTTTPQSWGTTRIGSIDFIERMSDAQRASARTVAVVDTGVCTTHEKLSGRLLTGTSLISSSYEDENGHGTHVSGIIVDATPDTAINILPVQVLSASGSGSTVTVAAGVQWAMNHGATVINMSLGGIDYSSSHYLDTYIQKALSAGVIVCVAAGNDNMDTTYVCPAHISGLICVSAVDSSDSKASFSNYGSSVDLAAPGVDIYSSIPGGYASWNGTSMATPYVSAAAALVSEANVASGSSVLSVLQQYSDDVGSAGWDSYYGSGIVNLENIPIDSQATEAPTEATTEAPTTQAPTQAPTSAPTTAVPTTQAPTTQAPTTQAPTTQAPTTGDPIPPGSITVPTNGISVSVKSSSVNGVYSTIVLIGTNEDINNVTIQVDGADYKSHVVSDGNGQYHLDLSPLASGSHNYYISFNNGYCSSSSSGSFTK